MESTAATLLLQSPSLVEAEAAVDVLISDADSSTAAAVKKIFGNRVKRALDHTHSKKNFRNSLYDLRKTHRHLSAPLIKYLVAIVGTVLKKCKGSEDQLVSALKNVPDHVFNKHDACDAEWCRTKRNPDVTYKSKYINTAIGSHGCSLYLGIKACFERLISRAQELAAGGSTLPNESFNNQVASKAPKPRHYGDTESLTYRVSAAVAQKNRGVTYVVDINEELGLSPGKLSIKYKERLKEERRRAADRNQEPHIKARRKINFEKRASLLARQESQEGTTYQSGMGFHPDHITTETSMQEKKLQVWRNPPVSSLSHLSSDRMTSVKVVYFDLETTGLSCKYAEILQISAKCDQNTFNVYCFPRKHIPKKASEVNSLTVEGRKMFYKETEVPSCSMQIALKSFLTFLEKQGECILVAHNATFDAKFLVKNLHHFKLLQRARTTILGIVDTLRLTRKKLAEEKKSGRLLNFKLSTLATFVLGDTYNFDAHNAEADVAALQNILVAMNPTPTEISAASSSFSSFIQWWKMSEVGRSLDSVAITCGLTLKDLKTILKNKPTLKRLQRRAMKSKTKFCQDLRKQLKDNRKAESFYTALIGNY